VALPRLSTNQILYLALEGGGGKGNAFVGALRALADPKLGVLQFNSYKPTHLRGFSGASAGAITSCMLSCGYEPEELAAIMRTEDFDEFFETLRVGYVPTVGGFKMQRSRDQDRDLLGLARAAVDLISGRGLSRGDLSSLVGANLRMLGIVFASVLKLLGDVSKSIPAAARKIGVAPDDAVSSLANDLGIFPGEAARRFMHKWITIAAVRATKPDWLSSIPGWNRVTGDESSSKRARILMLSDHWKPDGRRFPIDPARPGMTFDEHQRIFGVKLAVTGTELESQKTHVFSASTTPNFLVEDAVRMSMSLPCIFKPYVIRGDDAIRASQGAPGSLEGVWVDGGVLNNLPLHVFDKEEGDNPKTLGLRLGKEERTEIKSLEDLLTVWPLSLGASSGESQISFTLDNVDASIILDPTPLGLLDFAAAEGILENVQKAAFRSTVAYFDIKGVFP
jgi:predicted acylesterase/phospholipase RssA